MQTTLLPKDNCPACTHKLDSHTHPKPDSKAVPTPGDFSMCAYCFVFLRYDSELKLIYYPDELLLELPTDVRLELTNARNHFKMMREET